MSFDALLSLIFVLLFIGGPLLRRMSGGKNQPGRGQRKPAGRPEQSRERQAPSEPEAGGEGGEWSQRLEEARKRVLEAMGEQEESPRREGDARADSGQSGSSGGLDWQPAPYTTGSATDRPALDWQPDSNDARQQRPALDWQQPANSVEPFIKPVRRSLKEKLAETESLPVVVRTERRRRSRKAARMRERLPALGKDGILNGITWHEILSDPVSKRGNRRQTSRLRSR